MGENRSVHGLEQPAGTAINALPPGMALIPGGSFLMGSDHHYPEEAPAHEVSVEGFWMETHAVTNERFQRFVEATGYVTIAERPLNPQDYPGALPELLVPGSIVFQQPARRVDLGNPNNWWAYIPGASWRQPQGAGSSLEGREQHPVLHVAYADAEAYASWLGRSLPTEAQWERAARGGLDGAEYTWGSEFAPEGSPMARIWQGEFPWQNLRADGLAGPLPVGSFPPNGYGLYDMAGNVWEWIQDWYQDRHAQSVAACCIPLDPQGCAREQSYDPAQPAIRIPRKVLKGGSHLCAPNYCLRYRPAARIPQMIDTSTSHIGLRCVLNIPSTRQIP